jgi:hypothetical protein
MGVTRGRRHLRGGGRQVAADSGVNGEPRFQVPSARARNHGQGQQNQVAG